jgi:hypothetical protein
MGQDLIRRVILGKESASSVEAICWPTQSPQMVLPRLRRGGFQTGSAENRAIRQAGAVTLTSLWIGAVGALTNFYTPIFFTLGFITRKRHAPSSFGALENADQHGRRRPTPAGVLRGASLTGPDRREERARQSKPYLAVIRDVFRLGADRREKRSGYSDADPSVVLGCASRIFHDADFFHGNLQVFPTFSPRRMAGIQDMVATMLDSVEGMLGC